MAYRLKSQHTYSLSNVQGSSEDDVPSNGEVALLYPSCQSLITNNPRGRRQLLHQFVQPPRRPDYASLVYILGEGTKTQVWEHTLDV